MPIYASFLGHVEPPSIDDWQPRQIPKVRIDEARVDRRPAAFRRRRGQDA